ncbi:hypothetical protein [Tateyamaria sp.]|uniref:hypothetical protein n=1 Tax=Tateyamaria sp. TaxID=1929288 RepID=UPI00329BF8A5
MRHQALHELIIERMKDGWAPEQFSGRLDFEKAPTRIYKETIYRFVYSKKDMQEDLW